jgi:hypothetical protein
VGLLAGAVQAVVAVDRVGGEQPVRQPMQRSDQKNFASGKW